jgi:hypothetical protein
MTVLAHIAGMPVEETVASFGPILLLAGGGCVAAVRARLARLRVSPGAREARSSETPPSD